MVTVAGILTALVLSVMIRLNVRIVDCCGDYRRAEPLVGLQLVKLLLQQQMLSIGYIGPEGILDLGSTLH